MSQIADNEDRDLRPEDLKSQLTHCQSPNRQMIRWVDDPISRSDERSRKEVTSDERAGKSGQLVGTPTANPPPRDALPQIGYRHRHANK